MPLRLLKRECETGTGYGAFDVTEYRWNTDTRAVEVTTRSSNFCSPYLRPGDVVDRYCLAPRVAPFTERVVLHNGYGDVVFEDTDGVSTCALPTCTLAATVSTLDEGANTLGTASVTVSGAVGEVELSLDDFQTHITTSRTLPDLPAGEYLLTVREVRAEGCTVRVSFTVGSAYGLRFTSEFEDVTGLPIVVNIKLRAYTGDPETLIAGTDDPIALRWPGSSTDHFFDSLLRGSEAEISFFCTQRGQLADLYGSDERQSLVTITRDGDLLWRGWCLPEQWQEPMASGRGLTTIRATDAIGALQDQKPWGYGNGLPFRAELLSHLNHFRRLVALAGHGGALPISTVGQVWSQRMIPDSLACFLVDVGTWTHGWRDDKNEPWNAGDVFAALLEFYGARFYQWNGEWHLHRLSDLSRREARRQIFTTGSDAPTTTTDYRPECRIYCYDPALSARPHWVFADQSMSLVPAVRKVELTNIEDNAPLNLIPEAETWAATYFTASGALWGWSGALPYTRVPHPDHPSDPDRAALQLDDQGDAALFLSRKVRIINDGALSAFEYLSLYVDAESNTIDPFYPTNKLIVRVWVNGTEVGGGEILFNEATGARKRRKALISLLPSDLAVAAPIDLEIRLYSHLMPLGGVIREIKLAWGMQASDYESFTGEVEFEWTDPLPVLRYEADSTIPHATRTDKGEREITESVDVFAYQYGYVAAPVKIDSATVFQRGVEHMTGGPVRRWFEIAEDVPLWNEWIATTGGDPTLTPGGAMGDLSARDRLLWQRQPSRVLQGSFDGWVADGPGALLADEHAGLNLFVQTDSAYSVKRVRWTVRAVEMSTALATPTDTDDGSHLLLETFDRLLTETDDHIILE